MEKDKKDVIPKLKRKIYNFLIEEKGKISKQKALSLGSFLGSISILSLLPEVAATHTNSFYVSWSSGTIKGTHGHHASHSSHGSHSSHSSHGSHSSHSSHGSHASHSSGCFLAGTKILTPKGMKNIEDIKVGDYVLTYESLGVIEPKKVFRVFKHPPQESGKYYFIINNKIKVTPNHPVYINGNILKIENAKIGDYLIGTGETVRIKSIKKVYDDNIISYNIDTEDNRNYFADGILVHSGRLRLDFVVKGSLVFTPEGYKSIENIHVGDYIYSYNTNKGSLEVDRVTKKYENLPEEMERYYLKINSKFNVGPFSRFFTLKGWKMAKDIVVGDELLDENGKKISVSEIKKIYRRIDTYHIEVEKNKNFFLNGVLMHNKVSSCIGACSK